MTNWDDIKAQLEAANKQQSTCPSCGHCPTCGRGGHQFTPYMPVPSYPAHPYPYWWYYQTPMSGGTATTGIDYRSSSQCF